MPEQSPSYWFVGASYSDDGDQSARFLREGIWENGYTDKYLDLVRSIQLFGGTKSWGGRPLWSSPWKQESKGHFSRRTPGISEVCQSGGTVLIGFSLRSAHLRSPSTKGVA